MAEQANVVVKAKFDGSQASAGMKGFGKSILGAVAAAGAAIASIKIVIDALKAMSRAAAEAELADTKMAQSLVNAGGASIGAMNRLRAFSSEIQKQTVIGDEAVQGLISYGLNLGISTGKIEQATKGAIGLSKSLGIDLNASMKMVAQAQGGNYNMLVRYLPELKSAKTETEKMAIVNRAMADGFKIAQAETKTFSGSMAQMKNAMGDSMEIMGGVINKAIQPLAEGFTAFLQSEKGMKTILDISRGIATAIAVIGSVFKLVFTNIGAMLKTVIEAFRTLWEGMSLAATGHFKKAAAAVGSGIKEIGDIWVEAVKEDIAIVKGTAEEINRIWTEGDDAILANNLEAGNALIEQNKKTHDQITDDTLNAFEVREKANIETWRRMADKASAEAERSAQQSHKFTVDAATDTASAISGILGDITSMMDSTNKKQFKVMKGLAIAQATIDMLTGAQAAYKSLAGIPAVGPALGVAAAATAVAAGIMRISKIKSQKYVPAAASGALIPASASGTLVRAGENNRSEAIIPLENPEAMDKLRGNLGGPQVVIQVENLFADENLPDKLVKEIDRRLWLLNRRGSSLALGT